MSQEKIPVYLLQKDFVDQSVGIYINLADAQQAAEQDNQAFLDWIRSEHGRKWTAYAKHSTARYIIEEIWIDWAYLQWDIGKATP